MAFCLVSIVLIYLAWTAFECVPCLYFFPSNATAIPNLRNLRKCTARLQRHGIHSDDTLCTTAKFSSDVNRIDSEERFPVC